MGKSKQPSAEFIFESLMDTLPDAIYFKDRESRFIRINRACAEKHRWSSSDVIKGKTDFDVFSKEHAEQAFADEQRIIETGEPLLGIVEKETWDDGTVNWVSTTKMPLQDDDGTIVGTFGISRDITKHKEAEIKSRRYAEEIRQIKKGMEEDVRMAGELQKTFFPRSYPTFPKGIPSEKSSVEFLHHFRSCSDVSGDYCTVFPLSDTEAGIFLCDIQGIGLRAALGTALICGIVQELPPQGFSPGAYLERVNRLLVPLLSQDSIHLDIKAFYLVLNVETGHVRFASAGHPSPLWIKNDGSVTWLQEKQCGDPLAMNIDTRYLTGEQDVNPKDSVVLYTDGLLSVTNKEGTFFGKERLKKSAKKHREKELSTFFKAIEQEALSFSPEGCFSDDVCLVGFSLHQLLNLKNK